MKDKFWAARKTKKIVDDILGFFGPEHEYKLYVARIIGRALLEAINDKKFNKLEIEQAFEDSVMEYKQKNPNHGFREVIVYELAFFEAVKYMLKHKGDDK